MYFCTICLNEIFKEAGTSSAGDHDPAFHVVHAYHTEIDGICRSDNQEWPCKTYKEYQGEIDARTSQMLGVWDMVERLGTQVSCYSTRC